MESNSPSCPPCGAWWKLPALLILVLVGMLVWNGRGIRNGTETTSAGKKTEASDAASREHVTLEIDSGDGQQHVFDDIAWYEGMTVADLLSSAPDVPIVQQGTGQTAFLTGIYGVANEGAGGKNWTYEVNGESGDRSFAVYELHAGDRVLWSFAPPR